MVTDVDKMASGSPGGPEDTVDFGFRRVARGEKAGMVRGVFDSVAHRYDVMNDAMSGGLHRLWKDSMVAKLSPRPGQHVLDVAGGTGDVAFRILDRSRGGVDGPAAHVTVLDINQSMLAVGRDRALDRGLLGDLDWVCGDAMNLPLPDRSVDAYTIAFGIRNVTDIDQALREGRRVLKPGGRFVCLEFSRVVLPVLRRLYDRYSLHVVPRIGQIIARDEDSYRYLVESIRRFPDQQTFTSMIEGAGLSKASHLNLSAGIVAIHTAWRI
jgi:demethylmenaquinone methyltransferase/2-methoxy-6-polyprenyl-1,4-benzoquinol methylase